MRLYTITDKQPVAIRHQIYLILMMKTFPDWEQFSMVIELASQRPFKSYLQIDVDQN